MAKVREPHGLARFEGFELDLRSGELHREDGTTISLPDQPLRILIALLERPREVVLRDEIRKRLWPNDTIVEFEHSISAAMNRLRQALGDSSDEPRYIETLPRKGYRWKVSVQWVESPIEPIRQGELDATARAGTPAVGNLIGKKVSHYRVLELLGGGGMGIVFKAEDLRLGRRVALKFLPEELADDAIALDRFEREARAASALNHPNICTIYEIEDHERQPFIVMELLEGETLRELIDPTAARVRLPLEIVLDLAVQIADGLDAAHGKGIIHRDIKPANIFVTTRGQAKILDFGLAKLATDLTGLEFGSALGTGNPDESRTSEAGSQHAHEMSVSRTGVEMGTAGYMSPEQVRGETVDKRTDLFSFGLVLYEMVSGQRAFSAETAPIVRNSILEQKPRPIRELNPDISPGLEVIMNRALEKDRERRYQSASEIRKALLSESDTLRQRGSKASSFAATSSEHWRRWVLLFAMAILVIAGFVIFLRKPQRPAVAENDAILISDFVNTTGDPIFDGTLKQAVTMKLAESPYFNILPESKVKEALALMGLSSDGHVVLPVVREVCQRAGGKVVVSGAIAAIGGKYIVNLQATNCLTGAGIVHEERDAQNRDRVLSSLGEMIPFLRQKLGETISSIQRFNTPIEQATTKSLAALKAYTSGDAQRAHGGNGVSFYKMAIDLDPDFAIAYARLGAVYGNLADSALADEYLTKAFQRREHVSEREKFYITSHYYADSTRESDKAIETLSLWTQTYSHDWVAFNNLSAEAVKVGRLDDAVKAGQEALHLNPDNMYTFFTLSTAYVRASHFVEAKAVCDQAIASKRDSGDIHGTLFSVAFANGDEPEVQRQIDWFKINENPSPGFLDQQAWAAFSRGQVRKGRKLFESSRTASLQQRNGSPVESRNYAAFTSANEAQLEMEIGNVRNAREKAELALQLMPSSIEVQSYAALVFAGLGDSTRATQLTNGLKSRFPLGTLLNNATLPSVQAMIEMKKKNYKGAVDVLNRSVPYDLGSHQDLPEGVTMYERGLAYLSLGSGEEAAAQFQKLIDNRGIITVSPYWALAHLGLARAHALKVVTSQGAAANAARTRALGAYQEFLNLWKDADPDIPVLREAKAEYAKLQQEGFVSLTISSSVILPVYVGTGTALGEWDRSNSAIGGD